MDDVSKTPNEIARKGRRVRAQAPAIERAHRAPAVATATADRLPWETGREHGMFAAFRDLGRGRTVQAAYLRWCELNGKKPAKQPPSNWYELSGGNYQAFREAERRCSAIEKAEKLHGLKVDWDAMELVATHILAPSCEGLDAEVSETWIMLKAIECAFQSLAIDLHGHPVPGELTWAERRQAYEAAHPAAAK